MQKASCYLLLLLFSSSLSFAQPAIVVESELIECNLNAGEGLEFSFNVENGGDQVLRWYTTTEVVAMPEHVDPGQGQDIWGRFRGINDTSQYCSPVGWDRDNDWMWVTNYTQNLVVAYSFNNTYTIFDEMCRINLGRPMDGCWAAGNLWLPAWASRVVNKFDSEGNQTGAIQMPFPVYGIAADVENGWMFFINGDDSTNIEVYELDGQGRLGEHIGTIRNHMQFHGNIPTYSMEWVPEHPNRNLWMIDSNRGRVFQISVNPENWTCVETVQSFRIFARGDLPYSGVAHDGRNLWAGGYYADDIRIYDDGVDEFDWFAWSPHSGEIAPGSDIALECELTTDRLIDGEYRHLLNFISNDPAHAVLEVLVVMQVSGEQIAGIIIPDEAMNNGVLDYNRYFGELFARGVYRIPVTLYNEGSADLEIVRVMTENGVFQPEEFEFTLRPGQNRIVNLRFDAPPDTGIFEGLVTITTNDARNEQIVLRLFASTLQGPRVRITPEALEIPFECADSLNQIEIANLGQAPLVWDSIIEYFGRNYHEGVFSLLGNRDPIPANSVTELHFSIDWQQVQQASDIDSLVVHFNTNDPITPRVVVIIKVTELGVPPENLIPTTPSLSAFPNPFNSSTTINYSLPTPGRYAIDVIDIQGRLVARLSDGWREAGSYREVLESHQFSSGEFYVILSSEKEILTKSLISIK